MKAIVNNRYGSPDVLELKEIQKPSPKGSEILVKVEAASVNPLDWHLMRGTPYFMRLTMGMFKPKYNILGADIAGKVEAIGPDVKHFKVGDEVFGDIFRYGLGGLSEYVCIDETAVVKKPENLDFDEAAAVPVAALTALVGLRDYGKIKPGLKVLINGASGGVGTYAVQIAKSYNTNVTGVCSGRNIELVRSLGADNVVDYTKENFTTKNEKYDLIFDAVGNHTIAEYKKVLKPSGICAVVGYGGMKHLIFTMLFGGKRIKMVDFKATPENTLAIKELIEKGKIRSVIDRHYKLTEAPAAIAYLETGRARGKVIISVNGN